MKVLLLGPNGQLGTDIRTAVAARGAGVDLQALGRDRLDVADSDALREVLGAADFDVLVNCTSYHRTDEVESNATEAFAVNTHAVKLMAELCGAKRARLVHISTDYVFGGAERARPYGENDCPSPVNVYGASKAMGETLARLANAEVTVLRVASLFGVAGANGKGGNFVETMIRNGRDKGSLSVVDDITMSPTGTVDVADMVLDLLEAAAPPGIYHAVNSGEATWCEFASVIVARAGIAAEVLPVASKDYPTVARRPAYSVLDNTKIARALGRPIPHWTEALDRYLRAKGHMA
jgi:dTDP-4-dehydrorhamnose reductase